MPLPLNEVALSLGIVKQEGAPTTCNTISPDSTSRELLLFSGLIPVTQSALDPYIKEAGVLPVKVLVDSGAAVTFISDVLVQRLGSTYPSPT